MGGNSHPGAFHSKHEQLSGSVVFPGFNECLGFCVVVHCVSQALSRWQKPTAWWVFFCIFCVSRVEEFGELCSPVPWGSHPQLAQLLPSPCLWQGAFSQVLTFLPCSFILSPAPPRCHLPSLKMPWEYLAGDVGAPSLGTGAHLHILVLWKCQEIYSRCGTPSVSQMKTHRGTGLRRKQGKQHVKHGARGKGVFSEGSGAVQLPMSPFCTLITQFCHPALCSKVFRHCCCWMWGKTPEAN